MSYSAESDWPPSPSRSAPPVFCYRYLQPVNLEINISLSVTWKTENTTESNGESKRWAPSNSDSSHLGPMWLHSSVNPAHKHTWIGKKVFLTAWLYFSSGWKPKFFKQGDRLARRLQAACAPAANRGFHQKRLESIATKRVVLWDQWKKRGSSGDVLWPLWKMLFR